MAGVSTIVQGKNCVFQVNFGDGYKPVVCAKGFSVSINTKLKETTSRGSGVFEEYDYKSISYKVNLTGLIKVIDLDGDAIFFDLANYQKNFLELPFKALYTDPSGTIMTFRGIGVVADVSLNANAAQLADATCDIQGSGEYFIEYDLATGCINTISSISINGLPHTPGAIFAIIGTGNIQVTINSLASPSPEISRFDYELDGGGRNSAFGSDLPLDIGTIIIPNGSHVLNIWPVCDSGIDGTAYTVNITKGSAPPI